MGNAFSHGQNNQITTATTIDENTTINENNYKVFAMSNGQVNKQLAITIQKAFESSNTCSHVTQPIQNDRKCYNICIQALQFLFHMQLVI